MRAEATDILEYWLNTVGPDQWYTMDDALDADIRHNFLHAWRIGRAGGYDAWILNAETALALLILLDQFPRNMFRGQAEAFSSDAKALAQTKRALVMGHDMRIDEPARQFFYLPLMHAECLSDQDRCVRLISLRMPQTRAHNMSHALAHREIIRRFGRFPFRNDALSRKTSASEQVFMDSGGYREALQAVAT